jgi:hypothetical protein
MRERERDREKREKMKKVNRKYYQRVTDMFHLT